MVGRGRAHRQAGRRPGEGGLDAARKTSSTTSTGRSIATRLSATLSRRQDRRLETSSHRLVDAGALAAAGVPEGHRHRRRRWRRRHALRHPELPRRIRARRAAGGADRLLARRRPEQQRVRDRKLHRRAGAQGGQGSGRLPPRACLASKPRLRGGARTSRRRNPAGAAAAARASDAASACSRRSRSFIATVVEAEVDEHGEVRAASRRPRRSTPASPSIPTRSIAQLAGRADLRPDRGALWRDHHRQGPRAAVATSTTTACCGSTRCRRSRCMSIKSGEAPGGIGETGTNAGPPALRNAIYAATGVALAPPADRPRRAGRGEEGMSGRASHPRLSVVVDRRGRRWRRAAGSSRGPGRWRSPAARRWRWRTTRAPIPPASRQTSPQASLDRARRISGAARPIAMVCHTAHGRQAVCRRPRLQAAVRHAVFAQHHARQGNRHRQLERRRISSTRVHRGVAPGRRAALSGDAVHVLHLHDRRRRAGDQGLSVQPAAGARGTAREHAVVSRSTSAGRWLFWSAAVQSRQRFEPDTSTESGVEPRRLSRRSPGALRRLPHAAQPRLRAGQPQEIRRRA